MHCQRNIRSGSGKINADKKKSGYNLPTPLPIHILKIEGNSNFIDYDLLCMSQLSILLILTIV